MFHPMGIIIFIDVQSILVLANGNLVSGLVCPFDMVFDSSLAYQDAKMCQVYLVCSQP